MVGHRHSYNQLYIAPPLWQSCRVLPSCVGSPNGSRPVPSSRTQHKCRGLSEWPTPPAACGSSNPVGGYGPARSVPSCCLQAAPASARFVVLGLLCSGRGRTACMRCNARPMETAPHGQLRSA